MQKYLSRNIPSRIFSHLVAIVAMLTSITLYGQGTPLPVEFLPLGKDIGIRGGQTVTPAYEGWYELEDGRIALSFGYYNRNAEEILDIPVGPANRIIGAADGDANQGQPTQFFTGRHWGVFTVNIPADYEGEVVWHLENQGQTFHIPANLKIEYIIDAIAGDANGNFPPEISFEEDGPSGHGPAGIMAGPLSARVNQAIKVEAWVKDDGKGSGLMAMFVGSMGTTPPMDVAWFKQQGPGEVSFSEHEVEVPVEGGVASTEATFSEAGEYILRARVTEFSGPEMSGHSQCCWTNGFIRVNVSN